jgi:signal-transduction protein with cAMP-binding, CBS, and nucleotidyltransferase domain
MTPIERALALCAIPPFNRLTDGELLIIAGVTAVRRHRGGETIAAEGAILDRLLVLVEGAFDGVPAAQRLFGAAGILFERPMESALRVAADHEALLLVISRGHFHTIINECPEILRGLITVHQDPGIDSSPVAPRKNAP